MGKKMTVREIYQMLCDIVNRKPIYEDPKMQQLHDDYIDAMLEYGDEVKSGKATVENFTERWREIVVPKRTAYENYQTLKAMGVTMVPVDKKG